MKFLFVGLAFIWFLLGFSTAIGTLSCSDQARSFTEFHARAGVFKADCARGCSKINGEVKGSHVYTDDSSICKSAIHAGVINDNGGLVQVRRLPGRKYHASTIHNGITSSHSDPWTHSFSFDFVSPCRVRPLGLRNYHIPDRNFRASSTDYTWDGIPWQPWLARLDKGSLVNAWRPAVDNKHQWWQVDMGGIHDVRGIVTQGSSRYTTEQFITSFKVQHRFTEDRDWRFVLDEKGMPKMFSGNSNDDGRVTNNFVPSLTARYLRLLPQTWRNHISLRAEILFCNLPHKRCSQTPT